MDTTHKFSTWILLFLAWNGALLGLIAWLLWTSPATTPDPQAIGQACGEAAAHALETSVKQE